MKFGNYSKKYFPSADDFLRYISDFTRRFALRVRYNVNVTNIQRVHALFRLTGTASGHAAPAQFLCEVVVMATGQGAENTVDFVGNEFAASYGTMNWDPEFYEGKNVLILGKGNSAGEAFDMITNSANHIHLISRSLVRLSIFTHYVGDLRGINSRFLDQYQLKSLDGLMEGDVQNLNLVRRDGRLWVEGEPVATNGSAPENTPMRIPYDVVIKCLGFKPESYALEDLQPVWGKKYPEITGSYESRNVPGLYFAGNLAHGLDHRKASGGFIHGFRYTARALFHVLNERLHNERWPSKNFTAGRGVLSFLVERINTDASLYQMFGVLADVLVLRRRADVESTRTFNASTLRNADTLYDVEYLMGVPLDRWEAMMPSYTTSPQGHFQFVVVTLEYGKRFSGPFVLSSVRAVPDPLHSTESNFLHPILRYFDSEMFAYPQPAGLHHVAEDFHTDWNLPKSHVEPLAVFLDSVLLDKAVTREGLSHTNLIHPYTVSKAAEMNTSDPYVAYLSCGEQQKIGFANGVKMQDHNVASSGVQRMFSTEQASIPVPAGWAQPNGIAHISGAASSTPAPGQQQGQGQTLHSAPPLVKVEW